MEFFTHVIMADMPSEIFLSFLSLTSHSPNHELRNPSSKRGKAIFLNGQNKIFILYEFPLGRKDMQISSWSAAEGCIAADDKTFI